MNVQLIQLTESLRWALERLLERGEPQYTPKCLAAWGHLYQAECDWKEFCQDMDAEAEQEAGR